MVALIGFFTDVFSRFFTNTVVKFLAYKALLLFLFVFILPAVLLKLFFVIKLYLLNFMISMLPNLFGTFANNAGVVNITGVGAYIGDHLKLAQGVAVLVSCTLSGWIVRMIRG